MFKLQPAPQNVKRLCMLCAVLTLMSAPLLAQSGETDQVTSTPTAESASSRGRETQAHEAGSVEASVTAMRDRIFLRQAVTSGMLQLQVSELAQKKASGQDVRQYATHLVADHSRLEDGLRAAAESQGVMLPTKLPLREQAVVDHLSSLSGEEFDRDYVRTIVEDHHRDIREFRSEAANTSDESLRSTVQNGTKILHQQMVAADQIARSKGLQSIHPEKVAASDGPR